ncbi:MCE family protein [Mycobacterium sp. 1274756.6]|uniref:MCE family protein n=1 Tax=Mycobacterium sp. 1274756.6 TaxID=1834076 RepID=UPI0007FEA697|nr:MCE family protein [Mycobacterium sp. 1274756.6]OBJ68084.1 mammalian cell entry protein [Mycobacterium sp. 1274756.6]
MVVMLSGCGALSEFRGANSFPLPGTQGGGPGAYTVQIQMKDVQNLKQNSRVRVDDVTVGNVTKIERQGWQALVTVSLNGDVRLPENATATLGQTSLLGSLHLELAPPAGSPARGKLHDGSLIPLESTGGYPSTEQTLGALSLILNGGGIGQLHDITEALSSAYGGRGEELRSLITQLDVFTGYLDEQKDDIIVAVDKLDSLFGQFAEQKPILDKALETIPAALTVLRDQRENLSDALDQLGKFDALVVDSVNKTRENLVKELQDLGPVLQAVADAGPDLIDSLDFFVTMPFPKSTLTNYFRGDYANETLIIDLTLSRLDAGLLTGTRWEGTLTELELQWGRTIGQLPSPYTARNPLLAPYHFNQGP